MTTLEYRSIIGEAVATPGILAAKLERAQAALERSVSAESPLLTRFLGLRERLRNECLQLAVLGQFKRGKSTFVNVLLGAALLPMAVVPLTAVAIYVAWRSEPLVRVHFKDGRRPETFTNQEPDRIRDFLFGFVAEEANPENRLGVERVDLFYPAPILAAGVVLIDTPGVGSTLRHNTETALGILPECDAALFVISADPPITEIELEYLRRVRSKTKRIFFILNKVDYLEHDEQQRVVEFLQRTLRQNSLLDTDIAIFGVSARDGLRAKERNSPTELERSGIAAVENHLLRHLATEKTRWLEDAIVRKATDIVSQAIAEVDLSLRALTMPLEELTSKMQTFEDALHSIEEQRRITRDLLFGEKRRLLEDLESRTRELRQATSRKLVGAIDEALAVKTTAPEDAARHAVSVATAEIFKSAREQMVRTFSVRASDIHSDNQRRVDALVYRVQQTAAEIFDVSFRQGSETSTLQLDREPYWVTEFVGSTLIPDPARTIDYILPRRLRRLRLRARLVKEAEELVLRNAENLRWAIVCALDVTFRSAALQFEERLDDAITTTKKIIEDALTRRRSQTFLVEPEADRLRRATTSLVAARDELAIDLDANVCGTGEARLDEPA